MGPYFASLKGDALAIEESRARALTTIRQARATQAPEDLKQDTGEVRRILDESFDYALEHFSIDAQNSTHFSRYFNHAEHGNLESSVDEEVDGGREVA